MSPRSLLCARRIIAATFTLVLTACGGGGDTSTEPPQPPPRPITTALLPVKAVLPRPATGTILFSAHVARADGSIQSTLESRSVELLTPVSTASTTLTLQLASCIADPATSVGTNPTACRIVVEAKLTTQGGGDENSASAVDVAPSATAAPEVSVPLTPSLGIRLLRGTGTPFLQDGQVLRRGDSLAIRAVAVDTITGDTLVRRLRLSVTDTTALRLGSGGFLVALREGQYGVSAAVAAARGSALLRVVPPTVTVRLQFAGDGGGTMAPTPGAPCTRIEEQGAPVCEVRVPYGEPLVVNATPASRSRFRGYSLACDGAGGSCTTAPLIADTLVRATFELIRIPVRFVLDGPGAGSIRSADRFTVFCQSRVNTGAVCDSAFVIGRRLSVLAEDDGTSSRFVDFGGDCGTGAQPCTITADAPRIVSATFALRPFSVFVSGTPGSGSGSIRSGDGTIDCTIVGGSFSGNCSLSGTFGQSVRLLATPAAGQLFGGWNGAFFCLDSGPTCDFTAPAGPFSVQAVFGPAEQVTVSLDGAGSGDVLVTAGTVAQPSCVRAEGAVNTTTCTATVARGVVVTLSARPTASSTFSGFTGPCVVPGASTCRLMVPAGGASITGTFRRQ